MGIVRKQSIKNALNSYIGIILGAINTILIFPNVFYNQPEHWGLVQIVVAYAMVGATYTTFGTPRILIRYFPKVKEKGQLLFLGIILPIVGFLFTLIAYYLLRDELFNLINAPLLLQSNFNLVFILIILMSFYKVFEAHSRTHLDSVTPLFLRDVLLRVYIMILLFLHGLKFIDFTSFLNMYIMGYLLIVVILVLVLIKKNHLQIQLSLSSLDVKQIVKFGLYIVMGGATGVLVSKIDMMMIGKYLNLENVAYYALAFFVGSVIRTVGISIINIADPLIAQAWKNNEIEKIKTLYYKSSINQLIIGGFVFLGIWLNIDDIFYFLPDKFAVGKYVVLFIGFANLVQLLAGVNANIIVNSKYYKFDLYSNFILLGLTIITNMVFIPKFGINGAAFATALSIFFVNFIKVFFIYLKINIHPFGIKTVYGITIVVLTYIVVELLPSSGLQIFDISMRLLLMCLVFIPLVLRLKISEDINELALDIWMKLKK